MSVSTASSAARPRSQGRVLITVISVLVFAAVIIGLLFNDSPSSQAPSAANAPATLTRIAEAGVLVQVPIGWSRDTATVPGFTHPVQLRNSDENLHAAVELLPAVSPTLLPAAFLQTLNANAAKPDAVRLGSGHAAWRYRVAREDGSQLVIYAVPTTAGVATVACLDSKGAGIPPGCEALASGITVPDSLPLDPGRSAAFYSRLPAGVHNLDAARTKGTRKLSAAKRSFRQAAAADELARAHLAAGADLAPLTVNGDGMPTAAVGALAATAAAYSDLATAARARSPRAYTAATHAVTSANADLRRTMTKAAAAASAASRAALRTATMALRRGTSPVTALPAKAKAGPNPGANASHMDLTIPLAALLGVFPIFLAVRETLRVLR